MKKSGTPQIEFRPLHGLVPYARNARTHSPEQVAQIAGLITEFGWTNPILADGTGIVAGHGRTMAARQLYEAGKTIYLPDGTPILPGTVPVLDVSGWSDAKRRAYILADNKAALNAGWDYDLLRVEFAELEEAGLDLSLTAFDQSEINVVLSDLGGIGIGADGEGENASGADTDFLRLGKIKVPVSADEAVRFAALLDRYTEAYSVSHGFITYLCEGRHVARS